MFSRRRKVILSSMVLFVFLVSVLAFYPRTSPGLPDVQKEKSPPSSSPGSVSISNNILKVIIEDSPDGNGIGTFTIKTDSGHSNPDQNVFYGGASEYPWSTFTTIRVEDAFMEYVTTPSGPTASSGYTVESLDGYSPVVTKVSETRATVSWTTAEDLLVTLLIDIRGTTLADTMVEVTVTIQNDDTEAHSVAVRHEWDLMIDGSDDSWIRVWTNPSTPESWTETETDWVSPAFQFWETTNNPASPVFSIYGSTVLPSVSPLPTVPDRLVYADWSDAYDTAYDFATSGESGMDSAVLYYWNAEEISPDESISRTAYVTTVVGVELEALAWSTDSAGDPKSTFVPSDNVHVRGQGFPAETDVTVYLIPDGEDALPANTVASAAATTDAAGDLPNTLVWSPPITAGHYDVWVDVNRNGVFDAGDVWNNQAVGIYAFTVTPPAQYDLTIEVVGSGTTDPSPATYPYDEGTDVDVDAIPDSGWTLDHWELDGVDVGDADPYTVTMDADHTLTAVFTEEVVPPEQYSLTIEVIGSGTTDPSPATYPYDEGTGVPVDAMPAAGWTLDHWLLDSVDVGAADPYTVTMDDDHTLTAVFVGEVVPPEEHDVEAVSQTASENEVLPGTLVDVEVTVRNNGDFTESFDVTCYYDSVEIGTMRVEGLASGGSTTLTFTWDTDGVPLNGYAITAWADSGEEIVEVDEANNWCNMMLPVFVIPELPFGAITGLAACIAALGVFRIRKVRH